MAKPDLPRILCVDDEANMLSALRRQMRSKFNIYTAANAFEGLEVLKNEDPFDVIISDFRMPQMDGAEFLKKARELDPAATRILLTGEASLQGVQAAVNDSKIFKILLKPVSAEDLYAAVYGAIEHHIDKKSTNDQIDELLKSLIP
ncbi:MAG: response regulator [Gammaproteobacteria bacterium]|nr:response regulator [Gammaproteobacteria bacterium]